MKLTVMFDISNVVDVDVPEDCTLSQLNTAVKRAVCFYNIMNRKVLINL